MNSSKILKRRFMRRKKMTKMSIVLIGKFLTLKRLINDFNFYILAFFLASWTPYALVGMYGAFINAVQVSPYLSTLAAFLSKSSLIWPACLNIYVRKRQRKKIFSMMFKKSSQNCRNAKRDRAFHNKIRPMQTIENNIGGQKTATNTQILPQN